jgi:protein-S-isoprenylcysteine O-methyltransferase Ste14
VKYSIYLWAIWFGYWVISARNRVRDTTESTVQHETIAGRLSYALFMWIGFLLLFWRGRLPYVDFQLWPTSHASLVTGLAVQAVGLGFTVWARLTLGKNWSGRIATGGNQQLVTNGPYRFVRHPIYTGLLLAIAGLTLVVGSFQGLLGFVFGAVGVLVKIRREETSVRRHFGSAYEEYARRVPALFPHRPKAGSG